MSSPLPNTSAAFVLGKLFVGILCRPEVPIPDLLARMSAVYGHVQPLGAELPRFFAFEHTDYYQDEMGPHLKRFFVSVDQLYDPAHLSDAKHKSILIENSYKEGQCRQVNLDPGILFLHNVILLSTKNFAHRIPLSAGIYAEVTLIYQKRKWECLPWTFPDYKTTGYQDLFSEMRRHYHAQLAYPKGKTHDHT